MQENTTENGHIAGFVADHVHATNGVPVNDLFYLIIKGPCTGATKANGAATASSEYKQGGLVYASDEAGHVEGFTNEYGNLTSSQGPLNHAGRFMDDVANTVTSALVFVDCD